MLYSNSIQGGHQYRRHDLVQIHTKRRVIEWPVLLARELVVEVPLGVRQPVRHFEPSVMTLEIPMWKLSFLRLAPIEAAARR